MEHNHVVFIRKNKFFKVSLTTPEGRELTAAELEVQVERVLQMAAQGEGVPVGALTGQNRDVWADVSVITAYRFLFLNGRVLTGTARISGGFLNQCNLSSTD